MATSKVALQVRLDEKVHAKLRIVAEEEVRSLNSQIEYFVIKGIQKYEQENGLIELKNF
ncbi:Arc family DNA-binding protein [Anaerovibrio slackiae]|uniref:Arc family DNA-binding protein n=1 Tax=Anaerovibrio slackiae TaxID=2652309 RepID=UPI00386768E0